MSAHLVNKKGIRCPKCMASEEGPLPVYRKNGLPFSTASRMRCMSLWDTRDGQGVRQTDRQTDRQTKHDRT